MQVNRPYPGLRPFNQNENEIFFGREDQINELKLKLIYNRFVSIVGPSGSGKSSLVNAGLIPAIQKESKWKIITINPGSNPIHSLSEGFYKTFRNEFINNDVIKKKSEKKDIIDVINDELSFSFYSLIDLFKDLKIHNTKCLIHIDQFEEVFRYKPRNKRDNKATSFVYLLEKTIKQTELPIYTVISIRSDYIGDCMKFYDLSDLIANNIFIVPRLYQKHFQEIIEKPASLNFKIITNSDSKTLLTTELESGLVNKILSDITGHLDQLPVLQHAMWQMWNSAKDKDFKNYNIQLINYSKDKLASYDTKKIILTNKQYEKIGKLDRCLSTFAGKIFEDLNNNNKEITKKIFKCLINTETNHTESRKLANIKDIENIVGYNNEETETAIKKFSNENCFLIRRGETNKNIYEICHDSLIRQWDDLTKWKNEEIEAAKEYQFLINKSLKSTKLQGIELKKAKKWLNDNKPNKFWARTRDLNEKDNEKKDKSFEEVEKLISDSDNARKKQNIMICFFIFILIGIFYWTYAQKEKFSKLSFEYYLSHIARNFDANNFKQVNNYLKKTYKLDYIVNKTRKCSRDLLGIYSNYKTIISLKQARIPLDKDSISSNCSITNDSKIGDILFIGTTNGYILWFDLNKNKIKKKIKGHSSSIIGISTYSKDGWFITADENGQIYQWSILEGNIINKWNYQQDINNYNQSILKENYDIDINETNSDKQVLEIKYVNLDYKIPDFFISMSNDGQYLAYGTHSIVIRNLKTNTLETKEPIYPYININDIAIRHYNNKLILAIADDTKICLWEKGKDGLHAIAKKSNQIKKLSFSKKGWLIASTNRMIYTFDESFVEQNEIIECKSNINNIYFDRFNTIIATTKNKKILVSSQNKLIQRIFDNHQSEIVSIVESNMFNIYSIDKHGTIEKWVSTYEDTGFIKEIKCNFPISSIKLSPDTSRLIIGTNNGNNGILTLKDITSLNTIWEKKINDVVNEIVFSPDSKKIAIRLSDKISLLNSENGEKDHDVNIKKPVKICFIPNMNYISILSLNGEISMVDMSLKKIRNKNVTLEIINEKCTSMDFHPDGSKFAISNNQGCIYIAKYPELTIIQTLQVSNDSIKGISYSPDGQFLICNSVDNEIYLIDNNSLDDIRTLQFINHQENIITEAILPGNELVVSIGQDKRVRFWDLLNTYELFSINLPSKLNISMQSANNFSFQNNNKVYSFATALSNKTIVLYRFEVISKKKH